MDPVNSPFPVDVVLPWVDGLDPVLAAKRAQYAGKGMLTNNEVGGPGRYVSLGEIRYCIASVLRFAPFVRKIFIVTDGQDPDLGGMLREHFPDRVDDVVTVDHSVIFRGREQWLPTFNSNSIDTLIWNIPDLSEHYLYMNDDEMLIRPVTVEDFFPEGKVVCYAHKYPASLVRLWRLLRPHHVGFKECMLRSLELMGSSACHILYLGHTACPMLKSWFERWTEERPDMVERNLRYKFRDVAQFEVQEAFYLDMERQGRLVLVSDKEAGLVLKHYKGGGYVDRKLELFSQDKTRRFVCFNSLDRLTPEELAHVSAWLDAHIFAL